MSSPSRRTPAPGNPAKAGALLPHRRHAGSNTCSRLRTCCSATSGRCATASRCGEGRLRWSRLWIGANRPTRSEVWIVRQHGYEAGGKRGRTLSTARSLRSCTVWTNASGSIQWQRELVRFHCSSSPELSSSSVGNHLYINFGTMWQASIPGPHIIVLPGQEELLRVAAHIPW